MSRNKKILCGSLIALLVLIGVAYVAANVALDRVSRRLMIELAAKAEKKGIGVSQPAFVSARLSGLLSPTWSGLRANVTGSPNDRGPEWDLLVDQATLDWGFDKQADVIARGVTLAESLVAAGEQEVFDRQILIDRVRCQLPFDLLHPRAVIPEVLRECERLISEGTTSWPIEIDGKIVCKVKDKPAELRLKIISGGDGNSLALVEEDIAALSPLFEEKLTEAEVELVAAHPLRVMRLLQLKDRAETKSARASEQDTSVPQDAYRHILWSYFLAEAYGAGFAEQVGDAHEIGDTGNTEAEREMDLHNNAIGRKYAEEGIRGNELLQHVMSDPEVRRAP